MNKFILAVLFVAAISFTTVWAQDYEEEISREEREAQEDDDGSIEKRGAGFTKFQLEALSAHNKYRKLHGAPPMKLSAKLNSIAQKWANKLAKWKVMKHSTQKERGPYGENIFGMAGYKVKSGREAVDSWYKEIKLYKYSNPVFTKGTGHFTQVVWAKSTQLGIGTAGGYVVANYGPAGNMKGEFTKNVKPRKG